MVSMPVFHGMSGSRRGMSHERSGTPCQDHACCYESDRYAVAAVSDGHGGAPYFRSDVGSKAASECAVRVIREHIESEGFEAAFSSSPSVFLDRVCRTVLACWYSRVEDYDRTYPLTEEEAAHIRDSGLSESPDDPCHHTRYGATLQAAALSDRFSFCIQIGDGAMACIGEDGRDVSPMPDDPACRFERTTSLCQPDPLASFRYWFSSGSSPMAVVMATDGVTNTFDSEESFVRYCRTASCFALDGGNQWERLMDRNRARSDASIMDDATMAVVCRECPELRRMKDDIDARYRAIDLRNEAQASRSGGKLRSSDMDFELSSEGASLVRYRGSDETVAIPERVAFGGRSVAVSSVGSRAFSKSIAARVVVPRTVARIEGKAFYKCPLLKEVVLKGSPEIEDAAFFCCPRLVDAPGADPPSSYRRAGRIRRRARARARTGIFSSRKGMTGPCAR